MYIILGDLSIYLIDEQDETDPRIDEVANRFMSSSWWAEYLMDLIGDLLV